MLDLLSGRDQGQVGGEFVFLLTTLAKPLLQQACLEERGASEADIALVRAV